MKIRVRWVEILCGCAVAVAPLPVDAQITWRVSVDSSGAEGNGDSGGPSLSALGRWVAFHSSATNLVAGDNNGSLDAFVHDRLTQETTRVSVDSSATEGNVKLRISSPVTRMGSRTSLSTTEKPEPRGE